MIRQIVVSLLILIVAAGGYVFFVPGATDTLARYGIELPFAPAATSNQDAARGAGTGRREGAGNGGEQAAAGANAQGRRGNGAEGGSRPGAGEATPSGRSGAREGGAAAGGGGPPGGGAPGGGTPGGGTPGGGGGRGGNRTATAITAAVSSATINDKLTAIGEGTAAHSATVSSPSGGLLRELLVSPGDRVEPGQVIGHLDSESEQIAFDKANLANEDAKRTLERTTELAASNAVPKSQLATVQLAASNAELELRNAQLDLERRTITAPIAGTIGLLQVTPGNYVSAQTVVTTIDDTSEIVVRFWVPERYASSISNGMPVTASALALPGQLFQGTVSAVDNRIDPASRTLQVEARIPNTEGEMRAGMSFSVDLSFPGQTFAAVDPLSIQWSSEGAYVWRVEDGKVERALVRIVQRNSDGVLVEGDVAVGDQIVTEGVLQLSEGAAVEVLNAQATAEPDNGETPARPGGDAAGGSVQPASQL